MKQTTFLLFAGAAILALLYLFYVMAPTSAGGETVLFTVSRGEGFSEVAGRLEGAGLVRSGAGFALYAVLRGAAHRIQAGEYRIERGTGLSDLLSLFTLGPPDIVVVVREGETARDIDEALSRAGVTAPGEFYSRAAILEGFLFPDTYRFAPHSSPEAVIGKFLDNFKRKIGVSVDLQTLEALARARNRSSLVGIDPRLVELYTTVIVASLVEKEVPSSEERPVVAGILLKRLKRGMPLQVDASVIYAKCEGTFYNCPPLVIADFKINSPYNTYQRAGLPKGPIANPGKDAIDAATNPVSSPYWYYLSDPETEKTIFSRTLEEHAENKRLYLGSQ